MPRFRPDVVKRIIEGRDDHDIFEECSTASQYDETADDLVRELRRFLKR